MRERWFGATGRRVPKLALEGSVDVEGALVLDEVSDTERLREAHEGGTPVVVRAGTAAAVKDGAAQAAGGDSRGQQSAVLVVVERDGGYAGTSDTLVDLRVDDHEVPIEELHRLYGLHRTLFGKTPPSQLIEVDDELRAELRERLGRLGYERLEDWAGVENLEERVDGEDQDLIDPVVLDELRRKS